MKRKWTKLLAVMLAGVMALSCTVFASATDPYAGINTLNGEGAVDPNATGEAPNPADPAPEQKVETKYASGSAKGVARSEGPLPADPIRLELPTVDARTLDMILDPHGLINRTGMARYSSASGPQVSFSSGATLYFLNKITAVTTTSGGAYATTSGGTDGLTNEPSYSYTNETQTLTITNKSNLPVGVDVTLIVDKGVTTTSGGFNFDFVTSTDLLVDDDQENAQMYLALKHGDDEEPVAVYATDATIINPPTVDVPEAAAATGTGDELFSYIAATPVTGATAATYNTYPKATFQWAKAIPEAAEGQEASDDYADVSDTEKQAFIAALGTTGTNITMAYEKAISATSGGAAVPEHLTVTPVAPTGYAVEVIIDGVSAGVEGAITNTTRDVNVTVKYYKSADDTNIGFVYFVVQAGALGALGDTQHEYDVTLVLEPGDDDIAAGGVMGHATVQSILPKPEGAYVEGWGNTDGYFWAFLDDYQDSDGQAKLTEWKHVDSSGTPVSFTGTYPSFSFSITGAINGSQKKASPWDGHGDQIKLDLIWDVFAVDPDAEAGDDDGDDAQVGLPTVTVTTPATGTARSTKTATITWTAGEGNYEGYTPSKVTSDDGDIAITVSGSTFTMVATDANKSYANTKVVFTKSGSADVNVPLTGWYTGT